MVRSSRIALLSALLGSALYVGAQTQGTDPASVLALPNDTVKVMHFSDLCFAYRRINGDSALMFGHTALDLSRKLHFRRGEAQACNDISIILIDRSGFAEADSLLHAALRIRTSLHDSTGVGAIHNKLGNVYQSQDRFEDALAENLAALRIFERIGPPAKEAIILNNVAILQANLRRYGVALATHQKAAGIRRRIGDGQGVAESQGNMANVHLDVGDTTTAIGLYDEAINYFRAHDLKRELAIQLHNLAGVYLARHQPEKASTLYIEALALRQGVGEKKAIASTMNGLGSTLMQLGRMRDAKRMMRDALRTSVEVGARSEEMQAMLELSRLYAHANMGDSMLCFSERYSALKDSVFNGDLQKRTAEMEARYETEKKEHEIQRQRADLGAQNLRIAELGKRAERRRFWLAVALGGIGLVIVSSVLLMQVQRRRARAANDASLIAERERGLKAVLANTDAERKRIASELHDGVGQQLTGLKFRLEDIASRVAAKLPEQAVNVKEILSIADDASRDVRTIAHSMMPRALGDLGLAPALNDMLQKSLTRPGMHHSFEHFGVEARLPPDVEVGVYRIAQELVGNIIKHADARNVSVQLLKNKGHLVLIVEDDGRGIDPARRSSGMGMISINDRARSLHGTVDIASDKGSGTVATLRIPITNGTH